MERYYLGGYYLIKLKSIVYFGETKPRVLYTCSHCFNKYLFDYWCLSNYEPDETDKFELGLTDEKIQAIKEWSGDKYDLGLIKWGNTFSDLETAETFKNLFFSDLPDTYIYSIYLSETDTDSFLTDFYDNGFDKGNFALYYNLTEKIAEEINPNEELIGYDFIGVDIGGSFHSFYCHGIGNELAEKFSLQFNQFGLFDEVKQPELVRDYLNAPGAPVEPVPWYIAKTKRMVGF